MARLPIPGSDKGTWGNILNDFLLVGLNADGTVRDSGVVADKYVLPTGGIPETDLDSAVQTKLNSGGVSDPTLLALANLDSTAGLVVQTATDTFTKRTLSAGSSKISITNGSGASGNPTVDVNEGNLNPANFSTNPLARANHTGTQTASTISDLTESVQDVIGASVVGTPGSIAVNYDDGTGETTISAIGSGVAWGAITGTLSSQADLQTALDTKVVGPASATDNAVVRYDSTTGKLVKNSGVLIDNSNNMTVPGDVVVNTNRLVTATNGTNIGVGIGTASPASSTANRTVLHIEDTSGTGAEIKLNSTTAQARFFNSNSTAGFGTDTAHPLFFYTNGGGNNRMHISSTGLIGIATAAPTHSLTMASTTTGITMYNTADQTTNYERVTMGWSSNTFNIVYAAGTSNSRNMVIGTGTSGINQTFAPGAATGSPKVTLSQDVNTSGSLLRVTTSSFSMIASTSVTQYGIKIDPILNQTSTASSAMLWINPTVTATGSGTHYLIQAQTGSTDRFLVDHTGKVTSATDTIRVTTAKTPASAAATGSTGDIAWDSDFIYVCTATNTWKRAALSTW